MSDNKNKRTRFASALLDILDRVEYRRVPFRDQFDPVYRLRYEAYRREGFVAPNSERIVYDEHDTAPNVYCFGVYISGQLVSSIRFHHVTPEQRISPSRVVFPETLGDMLDRGISYIDPSRFTADHEASLAYPALPFLTLRVVAMASEHFDVEYCVSSVRKEHAAFYRRVFGSERLPGEGTYPGISFPMHLYAAKIAEIRSKVALRFPFFMSTRKEREAFFSLEEGGKGMRMIAPTARQAQDDPFEMAKGRSEAARLESEKLASTDPGTGKRD